ncbi:peptidase C39-like protein [Ureibacillus xyleni]|uniref:Peptidase C39-like protein n=1 Tax=Ureibacillus xyleni TaxID=614648 RepID=A0A285SXB6_9BACL|nr:C39 family peptidase [Ureibacillus xyleni]SOC13264.1 peptidase C39-like protein [Ureibacillus xyleni]
MKVELNLKGMSQYSESVNSQYQNSACGPTTIYVILNYLMENTKHDVNSLYKFLGSTPIGLFKWRLIKNLQKLLGPDWNVKSCTLYEALKEIDAGRPVAMKFDEYFTFQWKEKHSFKYHWVPLIGYEMKDNTLYLIVHDNGGKNRDSQIRVVKYAENYKVLSFVKIEPK